MGDGEEIEKAIQEGMQVKQWEKLLRSEQLRGFSCVLTSLPILAANFLLPSEILSQKHRNDLVIKHICLNHTIVSSPNLCICKPFTLLGAQGGSRLWISV